MRPTSPALYNFLFTAREFYIADLYTFNLIGGGTLRYCSGDTDIIYNSVNYPCGGTVGPYFDRHDNKAKCRQKIGTGVDTLVVDVLPGSAQVFGADFNAAVEAGVFDSADVTMDRLFMPTYGDTRYGAVRMFVGRVGDVVSDRIITTFNINSHMELANQNFPANLFQPGCLNNLGDVSCGVDLTNAAYHTTGTATGASTNSVIVANITNALVGAFNLGMITFTSGILNGLSRGVKVVAYGAPGSITLTGVYPSAPANGDTFNITFGCDKSKGVQGCSKFSNLARYRGFLYIPSPGVAIGPIS